MRPGNWTELDGLDAGALTDRLLQNLDLVFDGRMGNEESEDATLASLPPPLRVLWYLSWLDFEVAQGSLLAYFMNSHGRHAVAASAALRRVGAESTAAVLDEAQAVVRRNAKAWSSRRAEENAAGEYAVVHPYRELAGAEALEELTDRFRGVAGRDAWGEKLQRYIASEVDVVGRWASG
jgi:Domain of unknown function (DUF4375)